MDLKILQIPGGKDPDELFANGGAAAMEQAIQNTINWMDILRETLPEKFDMSSPVGRSQAAAFVASFLKLVSNQVELEVYVKSAAKMLEISENAMNIELGNAMRNTQFSAPEKEKVPVKPQTTKKTSADTALATLLELASTDSNIGRAIAEAVPPEYIPGNTTLEKALNMAINAALNDEMDSLHSDLQNLLIESPCPIVSKILAFPAMFQENDRMRAMQDAVAELTAQKRKENESDLLSKMRSATTPEEKMKILMELQGTNR